MQRELKSDNIPAGEMGGRYGAFLEVLDRAGTDALLLTDLKNIRYACGFTGSSALLLLTREKATFLTDGRYKTQASGEVSGAEVVIFKERLDSFEETVSGLKIRSISFESRDISHFEWSGIRERLEDVELLPLEDETRIVRSLKDESEVETLKRGAQIAREAFLSVRGMIGPGRRERDVALALEMEMRKRGAERASFDIIVASGKRSALPHAQPGNKEIEEGDLVVVDFGAVVDGYSTDETCTVKVGDVGGEAERIYSVVIEAHDRAIEMVRPGVTAKEVDGAARKFIGEKGYGEYFGHGTGHGVGLDVHELPVINDKSETVLEEGMVFTVEPGIYIPELGGVRIEDMVLVTSGGAEVITGCNSHLRSS